MYMFVCAFCLYPASLGWAVGCGCVCFGSGLGCDPPFLAGVLGCVWLCAHFGSTPPFLGRGCGACFWVRVFPFHPANPGWGVRAGWVSFRVGFQRRPSIPGSGVGLCVFVCALSLQPASPSWGVRCGCLCLGTGFSCAPQFLPGVLKSVCWCARSACTPPILARVLGRVCLCERAARTPPVLARVCGVDVCASGRISAAPRHFSLGCWGLSVCVHAMCVTRQYWLGFVVCVSWFGF